METLRVEDHNDGNSNNKDHNVLVVHFSGSSFDCVPPFFIMLMWEICDDLKNYSGLLRQSILFWKFKFSWGDHFVLFHVYNLQLKVYLCNLTLYITFRQT